MLSESQFQELSKIIGADAAKSFLEDAETLSKQIESTGVAHKQKEEEKQEDDKKTIAELQKRIDALEAKLSKQDEEMPKMQQWQKGFDEKLDALIEDKKQNSEKKPVEYKGVEAVINETPFLRGILKDG